MSGYPWGIIMTYQELLNRTEKISQPPFDRYLTLEMTEKEFEVFVEEPEIRGELEVLGSLVKGDKSNREKGIKYIRENQFYLGGAGNLHIKIK